MKSRIQSAMATSTSGFEPLTKGDIRSKILSRLKTQKEEDRSRKSSAIKKKLLRHKIFKKAKITLSEPHFVHSDGEILTSNAKELEIFLMDRKLKVIMGK